MATDVGYFSITNIDQCEVDGAFPAKDADELRTGLIGFITAGEVDLAGASTSRKLAGFVITNRTLEYRPTTAYAGDAEPLGLVRGSNVKFMCDSSFFIGDTLPTAGADLYMAASGKMDVTGTVAIGKVLGTDDTRAAPNTTKNLVYCEASFATV